MSTLSIGKTVWEERYVVLTRKGIHYYVRQPDGHDANRRDLFGQHDGSVGISNIARVDVGAEGDDGELRFSIVTKGGGRNYHFRAETSPLRDRWFAALQNAIAPPRDRTAS
eukprot:3482914-Prymnesium_polylepis.1